MPGPPKMAPYYPIPLIMPASKSLVHRAFDRAREPLSSLTPPHIISAGHTSSSAASRLVQKERPYATRTHVATRIPSNGHSQSQFDAKPLVEFVSIAILMPISLARSLKILSARNSARTT